MRTLGLTVAGWTITLSLILAIGPLPSAKGQTVEPELSLQIQRDAERLATFQDVTALEMSPDGEAIAYALSERDLKSDTARLKWSITQLGTDKTFAVDLDAAALFIRWLPNSKEFLAIVTRDGETIVQRYRLASEGPVKTRDYIVAQKAVAAVAISNDGRTLALSAARGVEANARTQPWPLEYEAWERKNADVLALYLVDLETGREKMIGPPDVSLAAYGGLTWSPDDRMIAATIDHRPNSQFRDTDIALFTVATGAMRQVTNKPGMDVNPSWSPDGKWVAFVSQFGEPTYFGGWPALLNVADERVTALPRIAEPRSLFSSLYWRSDSQALYYAAFSDMRSEMIRLSVLGAPSRACQNHPKDPRYIALRSFSRTGRDMAFVASTPANPPQIYVAKLDVRGCVAGKERVVWRQAAGSDFSDRVAFEEVSWPSRDKKFQIHASLLAPRLVSRNSGPGPGALYLEGGPDMVTVGFGSYAFSRVRLMLALRGFTVVTPNTRGRAGYGRAFQEGIRKDGRIRVPFEDAEDGMDWLIQRHIVDPQRQVMIGYSYGALLAAYGVSHTRRFCAAIVKEGASDMMRFAYPATPGTYQALSMRDLGGITNPFADDQRAILFRDSPGFHMENATTPTLLLYGAKSLAGDDGHKLWQALQHYNVPSRFLVYDEGHTFVKTSSLISAMTETVAWIDTNLPNYTLRR